MKKQFIIEKYKLESFISCEDICINPLLGTRSSLAQRNIQIGIDVP